MADLTKNQWARVWAELEQATEIAANDPERAHTIVDDVLLRVAPKEVRAIVKKIRSRAPWWANA